MSRPGSGPRLEVEDNGLGVDGECLVSVEVPPTEDRAPRTSSGRRQAQGVVARTVSALGSRAHFPGLRVLFISLRLLDQKRFVGGNQTLAMEKEGWDRCGGDGGGGSVQKGGGGRVPSPGGQLVVSRGQSEVQSHGDRDAANFSGLTRTALASGDFGAQFEVQRLEHDPAVAHLFPETNGVLEAIDDTLP